MKHSEPVEEVVCSVCSVPCLPAASISTADTADVFLRGDLLRALPQLILVRCPSCNSFWCADKRRNVHALLNAYQSLPEVYFEGIADTSPTYTKLYKLLAEYLDRYSPGRRVCDLGCGHGAFLTHLDKGWERFGIEPSEGASRSAQERGLNVRSGTIDNCMNSQEFDAVVAIDVLEHILDPLKTLQSIRARLQNGGIFIAVTGDAGALTATVAGPQWSYLRWSGHVSVLSEKAIRMLIEQAGFKIEVWRRYEHPASAGALAWLRVWALEPFRSLLGRPKSWFPFWRDHQLIIARAVSVD